MEFTCFAALAATMSPSTPRPPPSPVSWPSGVTGCDVLARDVLARDVLAPKLDSCEATNAGCPGDLGRCDCLVVNETLLVEGTTLRHVHDVQSWERGLATVQLCASLLSLTFGLAYLLCFAIWPGTMWRYPLSLAFWIYVCDCCVSLQFTILSATQLATPTSTSGATVLSSRPGCLCELGRLFGQYFPGCECDGGVLSFLVQGGMAGSVAFYFALAHNFYASVRDPFTRPKSRLAKYHFVCWAFVLLVSVPYLLPRSLSLLTGFGYRYELDSERRATRPPPASPLPSPEPR